MSEVWAVGKYAPTRETPPTAPHVGLSPDGKTECVWFTNYIRTNGMYSQRMYVWRWIPLHFTCGGSAWFHPDGRARVNFVPCSGVIPGAELRIEEPVPDYYSEWEGEYQFETLVPSAHNRSPEARLLGRA